MAGGPSSRGSQHLVMVYHGDVVVWSIERVRARALSTLRCPHYCLLDLNFNCVLWIVTRSPLKVESTTAFERCLASHRVSSNRSCQIQSSIVHVQWHEKQDNQFAIAMRWTCKPELGAACPEWPV
ncbi:hypothetical protein AN958_00275 [Leucoagaricus sp. SymC.cos]|nr:hypothetical protein AN958_00275 [Leucoagaricus sp. SymC.cos]